MVLFRGVQTLRQAMDTAYNLVRELYVDQTFEGTPPVTPEKCVRFADLQDHGDCTSTDQVDRYSHANCTNRWERP